MFKPASRRTLALIVPIFGMLIMSCGSTLRAQQRTPVAVQLKLIRTIALVKPRGTVDQLIMLPDGSFLTRDSTFEPSKALQVVELYSANGTFLRQIGSFGLGPGHYVALKEIAFSTRSNLVWVVDFMGRISRFDLTGKLISSTIVQKPGFRPYGIALDEDKGRYYLTGCVAQHFYLDLGCTMIHEYDLSTDQYIRSFAANDQLAVDRKYFSLEDYHLAIGPNGYLFAIDAPIRKLFRIAPSGDVESFAIPSKKMPEIAQIDPTRPYVDMAKGQYLLESIMVRNSQVILSATTKGGSNHLLEVLDLTGRSKYVDIEPPGRLLGMSSNGDLWFGSRSADGFQLSEYELE